MGDLRTMKKNDFIFQIEVAEPLYKRIMEKKKTKNPRLEDQKLFDLIFIYGLFAYETDREEIATFINEAIMMSKN